MSSGPQPSPGRKPAWAHDDTLTHTSTSIGYSQGSSLAAPIPLQVLGSIGSGLIGPEQLGSSVEPQRASPDPDPKTSGQHQPTPSPVPPILNQLHHMRSLSGDPAAEITPLAPAQEHPFSPQEMAPPRTSALPLHPARDSTESSPNHKRRNQYVISETHSTLDAHSKRPNQPIVTYKQQEQSTRSSLPSAWRFSRASKKGTTHHRRWRIRVPLWILMLTIPILAMILVGGIAVWFSYERSQSSINNIANSYRSLTCTVVENEVKDLIESLDTTVNMVADYVRTSELSTTNPTPTEVRKIMSFGLNISPWLTSIYLGQPPGGGGIAINRDPSPDKLPTWWVNDNRTGAGPGGFYVGQLSNAGWEDRYWQNLTADLQIDTLTFNTTQRVWYKKAAATNDTVLPPAYASLTPEGTMLSQPASLAVRQTMANGSPGPLMAVVAAEVKLDQFDDFLRQTASALIEQTILFLVEKDSGYLVASSVKEEHAIVSQNRATGDATRVLAVDVENNVIRTLSRNVADSVNGWKSVGQSGAQDAAGDMMFSTGDFLVTVRSIQLLDMQWVLVVGTNRGIWMSTVNSGVPITIGIVVGIIVGCCLLLTIVSRWITSPLRRVIRDVQNLSQMEVDKVPPLPSSWLSEITSLVDSINALTGHLREFRKFLPQPLLWRRRSRETMSDDHDGHDVVSDGEDHVDPDIERSGPGRNGVGLSPKSRATIDPPLPSARSLREKLGFISSTESEPPAGSRMSSCGDNITPTHGSGRAVTVACIDMEGFQDLVFSAPFEQVTILHRRYIDIISAAVSKQRGLLDKIIGDRVFAVWNVPHRCSRAELHAVRCCMQILNRFNRMNTNSSGADLIPQPNSAREVVSGNSGRGVGPQSPVTGQSDSNSRPQKSKLRMGIASGPIRYGILGNDTMHVFAVISPAMGQAVVLQKVGCKQLNVDILMTEAVTRQVETQIVCLPAIPLCFAASSGATVAAAEAKSPITTAANNEPASPTSTGPTVIPCYVPLREFNNITNTEWMYALRSDDPEMESLRKMFATYCTSVRDGVPMANPLNPQDTMMTSASSLSSPTRILPSAAARDLHPDLWTTMVRFPRGLEIPYTF